jgi:hypothetical protein
MANDMVLWRNLPVAYSIQMRLILIMLELLSEAGKKLT